jgi:phosphoribosyl-ATP pyrophosphohydrolase/phosphoribosyl-AMP cyclohydrolase
MVATTVDPATVVYDDAGLIPAIVQDAASGEVLMLAYMNQESLVRTLETGQTHFWSRSRKSLWHKGETSGNLQRVVSVSEDCDRDTLLVRVDQIGVACHTGTYTCFEGRGGEVVPSLGEVLGDLARVVRARHKDLPEGSYTTQLLSGGEDRALKKIAEEAGEVIIAAKNHARGEISWEAADLLYHLLVVLEREGVTLSDVSAVLQKRRASGK